MNPFKLKHPRWLRWRVFIPSFLVIALLAAVIPWPRAKTWARIQCAEHGPAITRSPAIYFLGVEGDDPKVIVPVLLSSLKDKNVGVREMAALSLGHIHQNPEQVVPALLACMDKEPMESLVPMYGYLAIGSFGTNARAWSPVLVQTIESNPSGYWISRARSALVKIDPEVGGPLVEQYLAGVSNRVRQAQLDEEEKQRRKALAATNPPSVKP
jgi:hypothetical protein